MHNFISLLRNLKERKIQKLYFALNFDKTGSNRATNIYVYFWNPSIIFLIFKNILSIIISKKLGNLTTDLTNFNSDKIN